MYFYNSAWVILIAVRFVNACARTMPSSTPTCQTCSLSNIDLAQSTGTGTVSVQNSGVSVGSDGCNQLTVTCDAGDGNTAFMQFNVDQGGPSSPVGEVVTATLTCNSSGNWVYTDSSGVSRVITEVNCVATSFLISYEVSTASIL